MFDQALRINPKDASSYKNKGMKLYLVLGNALLNLGKPNEAIIMFDQALRINPYDKNSYNNKGMRLNLF